MQCRWPVCGVCARINSADRMSAGGVSQLCLDKAIRINEFDLKFERAHNNQVLIQLN